LGHVSVCTPDPGSAVLVCHKKHVVSQDQRSQFSFGSARAAAVEAPPTAVAYLAKKGIRCVATDGPTLGGAGPKRALMTYWALGSRGMVGVEYLTNVAALQGRSYFLFGAVKIRDCHGGPGRAVALHVP
jgi:kynurenine formamidase